MKCKQSLEEGRCSQAENVVRGAFCAQTLSTDHVGFLRMRVQYSVKWMCFGFSADRNEGAGT